MQRHEAEQLKTYLEVSTDGLYAAVYDSVHDSWYVRMERRASGRPQPRLRPGDAEGALADYRHRELDRLADVAHEGEDQQHDQNHHDDRDQGHGA
jgi:hypothetical protein